MSLHIFGYIRVFTKCYVILKRPIMMTFISVPNLIHFDNISEAQMCPKNFTFLTFLTDCSVAPSFIHPKDWVISFGKKDPGIKLIFYYICTQQSGQRHSWRKPNIKRNYRLVFFVLAAQLWSKEIIERVFLVLLTIFRSLSTGFNFG